MTYGSWFSSALHSRDRWPCCCSMVPQLVLLFEALLRVTIWSCAQPGSHMILSNTIIECYLWTRLIHNPHMVTKTNEVFSQVYATVLSWYWLKSYHLWLQLPYPLLDFNPVGHHTKKHSLCIVCCPAIACCCNFPRHSLSQFGELQFDASVSKPFNLLWSLSSASSIDQWMHCECILIQCVLLVSHYWVFLVSLLQDNSWTMTCLQLLMTVDSWLSIINGHSTVTHLVITSDKLGHSF